MKSLKHQVPEDFARPTALPESAEQYARWQKANRLWWESHPMRYDWRQKVVCEEFSKQFYLEIDRRFFLSAKRYMPWKKYPFDRLIDFESLRSKDVLEIGVGSGSHAQLLAQFARSFTGIDITNYAVRSTSERMKCFGLEAAIRRMDAERMEFDDDAFDFIWSWGVIHHSANTPGILKEMRRVLKPGGTVVTMVYHRSLWNYYVVGGIFHGILGGDLLRTGSLHNVVQRHTDGAIARYYSISEWRRLVSAHFRVERILVFGDKPEIVPLPAGKAKRAVMALIPDVLSRFLTNQCKMGSFLVSILEKTR